MEELSNKEICAITQSFKENASCVRIYNPDPLDLDKEPQMTVIRRMGEITGDCVPPEVMRVTTVLDNWGFVLVDHWDSETKDTELNYLHPDEVEALSSLVVDGKIRVKFSGIDEIKEIPTNRSDPKSTWLWRLLQRRRLDSLEPIASLD